MPESAAGTGALPDMEVAVTRAACITARNSGDVAAARWVVAWEIPRAAVKKTPVHVLVVDDEPLIRWSVTETLADLGLDVEQADSASPTALALDTPELFVIGKERTRQLADAIAGLSKQQRACLHLRAEGLRYREIAAVLEISAWTVCTHLRRIFAKLGVGSRAAMVAKLMDDRRVPPISGRD